MFYRYTERYRQSLKFACDTAIEWRHSYVGCEHLLIGLLRTTDSVAACVLNSLTIDEAKARAALAEFVCMGREAVPRQRLARTRRAKRALKTFTGQEARRLHHRYIGTEHLLLALLRDRENMAARILEHLGIEPDRVQRAVRGHVLPGH